MQSSVPERVVLFLQGPASKFWSELAAAFSVRGARVLRIRLSTADHLFWRRPAVSYRGTLADWPAFLSAFVAREGVTDIVYYADRQPYHAAAAEVGARLGVRCHVIENGYLRPDWITLERGGMGVFSHFPDDPAAIRAVAQAMPEPDFEVRYRHGFAVLAVHEVTYDLLNLFGRPFYRNWDPDKYYHPLVEFVSWIPRAFHVGRLERAAADVEGWDETVPFWLLAMQLQHDYQIRTSSHYDHLSAMFREVVGSFARHAAPEDRLVIKLHPHDPGLERWDLVTERLAEAHGVSGRVHVIIGGSLGVLLGRTKGVVLVNSTVGIHTLRAGKPLKVLGGALYDMPGLSHQGSLDTFWTDPEQPDLGFVDDFVRALAGTIQVKGDFYDPAGRRAAIDAIVERILSGRVNQPDAFVDPPPRLARFRAEGEAQAAARGGAAEPVKKV